MSRSDQPENRLPDGYQSVETLNGVVKDMSDENRALREENQALKDALKQSNIALSSQMKILGALESQANENYNVLARQVQALEELVLKRSDQACRGSAPTSSVLERDQLVHKIAELQSKLNKVQSPIRGPPGMTEDIKKLISTVQDNEKLLKEKHRKIMALESRINQLEIENEAIEILKSQVMVYKTDYAELEKQNEELRHQSTTMKEELRRLNVTRKSPVNLSTQVLPLGEPDGAQSFVTRRESDNRLFKCLNPSCSSVFTSERLLREHVERCLQLS